MIEVVIATGFIPLSMLSIVATIFMWERRQWLGKNKGLLQEPHENMDRCTDCCNITEILLKTALNTINLIVYNGALFFSIF